ncbi:MAG: alcohol dehydrogenase catalytic domain-containing protein [Pseudomonadota bacterium]|nr:alcohol dehydrogenase catalytic domain-containing protein [Pseudomonadota bacterium]
MQALRKIKPGPGIQLDASVPAPTPRDGEVLLRVHSAGICGTDLHIDDWTASYHFVAAALPVTLGHEFSGQVVAVGPGVEGLAPQGWVAVRPSTVCGMCAACTAGNSDACTRRRGIGVTRDGGFASVVAVPAQNCVPVPRGLQPEIAALAEPLTVSFEAVASGGVTRGDRVLVLGPGNIGQGIALFAREAGAATIVVAGYNDASRMAILKQMGFTDLIDFASSDDMISALEPYVGGGKFDVVFEASGAATVIQPALRSLRLGGTLVVVGIHAAKVPIDLTWLVRNQQSIRGSYRAPENAWPKVLDFALREQATLRHMITHRLPLSRATEGFALAHERAATKVMIQPHLDP